MKRYPKARLRQKVEIDEPLYHAIVKVHHFLIMHIARRYTKEVYNQNRASGIVAGDYTLPIAIELSQWRYDITHLTAEASDIAWHRKTEKQWASQIKDILWTDYTSNMPQATFAVLVDVIDNFNDKEHVVRYVKLALRRCGEVFISSKTPAKWLDLLQENFAVETFDYPDGKRVLISVKNR